MTIAPVIAESGPDLEDLAEKVAGACFILGLILVVTGVGFGLYFSFKPEKSATPNDFTKKIKDAASTAKAAKTEAESLKKLIGDSHAEGAVLPAGAVAGKINEVTAKVDDVAEKAAEAEAASTGEQIASIISSLPVTLRFYGLVILIGTILMSVGTVQFGGTSLF